MLDARPGDVVVATHTVTDPGESAPAGWSPVGVAIGAPQLAVALTVRLVRWGRGKCAHCGLRRVLYGLVVAGDQAQLGPSAESPRVCAEGAGIGPVEPPRAYDYATEGLGGT